MDGRPCGTVDLGSLDFLLNCLVRHTHQRTSTQRMIPCSSLKRLPRSAGILKHSARTVTSLPITRHISSAAAKNHHRVPSASLATSTRLSFPPITLPRRSASTMVAPSGTARDYGHFKLVKSFDLDYAPVTVSKWRSDKTGLTVTLGNHSCKLIGTRSGQSLTPHSPYCEQNWLDTRLDHMADLADQWILCRGFRE